MLADEWQEHGFRTFNVERRNLRSFGHGAVCVQRVGRFAERDRHVVPFVVGLQV